MYLPVFLLAYLTSFFFSAEPFNKKTEKIKTNINEDSQIFTSSDSGKSWEDISGNLPKEKFQINCVLINDKEILLGAEDGLYRATTGDNKWAKDMFFEENIKQFISLKSGLLAKNHPKGLFKNIAGTGTWVPSFRSLNADIFLYTINETADGDLFASTNKGLLKSTNPKGEHDVLIKQIDFSAEWKSVISGKPIFKCVPYHGMLFALSHSGIIRSVDQGKTWSDLYGKNGETLELKTIENRLVAFTTGLPDHMIGPRNVTKEQMHFSEDNGLTWQAFDQTLQKESIFDFDFDGKYILISHDKGISRTMDWGKTWELILPITDKKMIYRLDIHKGKIYCYKGFAGC